MCPSSDQFHSHKDAEITWENTHSHNCQLRVSESIMASVVYFSNNHACHHLSCWLQHMVVIAQYITRQDMCCHRKPYNKTCNETLWSAFLCIRLLVMVKYRQTCCATGCSISSNRLKINDTGPGRRLVKSQAFPRASFSENIERLITWFVLARLGDRASPLVVRSVVVAPSRTRTCY